MYKLERVEGGGWKDGKEEVAVIKMRSNNSVDISLPNVICIKMKIILLAAQYQCYLTFAEIDSNPN